MDVRSVISLCGRNETDAANGPGSPDYFDGGALSIRGRYSDATEVTIDDVRFEYTMSPGRGAALWCGPYVQCALTRSSF